MLEEKPLMSSDSAHNQAVDSNISTEQSFNWIKNINMLFFLIFALFTVPYSNFIDFINEANLPQFVNFIDYSFVSLFSFIGLIFLCKNLKIYGTATIRLLLLPILFILLSGIFHLEHFSFITNELFPYTAFFILFYALHQLNYSEKNRLNIIFILFLSCLISSSSLSFATLFGIQVHPNNFSSIMPYVGITIGLYLLNSGSSIYRTLLVLLSVIFLSVFAFQNITIETICIGIIPIVGLLVLLINNDQRLGWSTLICIVCTLTITYFLNNNETLDLYANYVRMKDGLSQTVPTALRHIITGSGYNTYSFANLEANPGFYIEYPDSKFLKLATECGLLGIVSWLTIIFAIFYSIFTGSISLNSKLNNLFLIWPFIVMFYISNYMHNTSISYIFLAFILYHIDSYTNIKTKPTTVISLSRKGISKVSSSILFIIVEFFTVTGLVSVYQISDLENSNECENLQGKIINPFTVSLKKTEHEFKCIYNTGVLLPSQSFLSIYLNHSLTETVPYNPKVDYFQNIGSHYYLFEEKDQNTIKEIIHKYDPSISINEVQQEGETNENDKGDSDDEMQVSSSTESSS